MRPRGEELTTHVTPADDLAAGKGDHHRIPVFEVVLDEPQCVRFGLGFEHRQIFALTRDEIESASIALDAIERHWLDPDGRLVQS